MKLLTQAIKRKLPKIYATESIPLGMKIERDIYFEDYKVKDVYNKNYLRTLEIKKF